MKLWHMFAIAAGTFLVLRFLETLAANFGYDPAALVLRPAPSAAAATPAVP